MSNERKKPLSIIKIDNLHVLLWLIKDISWCLDWKKTGVAMIVPAVIVAVYLLIKSGNNQEKIVHNSSIVFWISANSIWMSSEFYDFEESIFNLSFGGRHIAAVLFIIGISIVVVYYAYQLFFRRKSTNA
jgi:hypothetical protein